MTLRVPFLSPQSRAPHLRRWLLLAGLFLTAAQGFGQGCTQCLDSTRATPPAVQTSYRHAICLLGGAAAVFFIAGLLLFRRES